MNPHLWTSHKARVAADFGAAAGSYEQVARLQRAVVSILLEKLETESPAPGTILDLGCGTGLALQPLAGRFPGARLLALDLAEGMIRHARSRQAESKAGQTIDWLVGDAEALPLASASQDLIFSSLAIQWCENTAALFDELARVLKPGGSIFLSTLVEGTLEELRLAWDEADPGQIHVNQFLSLERLEAEVRRVLPEARIEVLPLSLAYPNVLALLRELKSLGARYKDASRRQAATAPGRLRRLGEAYGRIAGAEGQLPATYQVAVIQL